MMNNDNLKARIEKHRAAAADMQRHAQDLEDDIPRARSEVLSPWQAEDDRLAECQRSYEEMRRAAVAKAEELEQQIQRLRSDVQRLDGEAAAVQHSIECVAEERAIKTRLATNSGCIAKANRATSEIMRKAKRLRRQAAGELDHATALEKRLAAREAEAQRTMGTGTLVEKDAEPLVPEIVLPPHLYRR